MRRTLVLAAILTTLTAACGADSNDAKSSAKSPDKVTVGVIPILDVAPIYLGRQKGFFRDRNIDLVLELAQGGAAITPAVVSGQYQFGFSNLTSLLIARSKDLPLTVVSAGSSSNGKAGGDFGALVVKNKSTDIKGPGALAGRKVAVNTLNNIGDTVVRRAVAADGGDASKIQFVEMPFPDMPAALDKGDIDAAFIVEPFLTVTLGAGARSVSSVFAEADPNLPVAVYFTTEKMRSDNADLVKRFTEAIKASQTYAQQHPDETRQILSTYTKIEPATIAKVVLPAFPQQVDRAAVKVLADLVKQHGLVTKDPDLDALLGDS